MIDKGNDKKESSSDQSHSHSPDHSHNKDPVGQGTTLRVRALQ